MGTQSQCPHCHSTDNGTKLYRCQKCETVYCAACGKHGAVPLFAPCKCPACQHAGSAIGRIWNDD
ncbi:MAG: hypothetical protein NTV51_17265 [Verrucomicrobia bacterium]|nr:hypothetical protein [Verrucomicrobiota bacterium]